MKKLLATLAIGAFAFVGIAPEADARPGRGHDRGHERGYGGHDRGHHRHSYRGHRTPPSNHVYVSSYRYGRPIYTEKYFVGWDRYGRPTFAYRTVSAPRHHRGYYGPPRHRSGTSVSFSFGF